MNLNLQFSNTKILEYLFSQFQWFDDIIYLRMFFEYYNKIVILMFDTCEELSKYINRKIPSWVIATHINNTILILDYEVWKSRNHGCFIQILTHEFVHVIISNRNKEVPMWLNEGLAVYFAKQLNDLEDINAKTFVDNIYNANYNFENFYNISGLIVQRIIEIYGIEIILRIPKISDFETDKVFGIENLKMIYS
jgi:hypothetical protein